MSKPQFVLEEVLESYLGQSAEPHDNRTKAFDSIVGLATGILVGLKAARGEILTTKEPNNDTYSFTESLARHFKAVQDTTCNCLFCRSNLNTEAK